MTQDNPHNEMPKEKETITAGAVFMFTAVIITATTLIAIPLVKQDTYVLKYSCNGMNITAEVVSNTTTLTCN